MKTILATTYAVDPYKGSENGMGWNFVLQIAEKHKVVAVTRKNNRPNIERYQLEFEDKRYQNITWKYYDLPYWMRFWKRGQRGALLYFYLWQMFMPLFVLMSKIKFDIAHNVNFHNDWTPSFLWVLGKPFVWGPIGHHPKIPYAFSKEFGFSFVLKEELKWLVKLFFLRLDPFVWLSRICATKILCMNSEATRFLWLFKYKSEIMTSVSSEMISNKPEAEYGDMQFLFVGRFEPLKGVDLVLEAFKDFVQKRGSLSKVSKLILVGKGSYRQAMDTYISKFELHSYVQIIDWIPRKDLKNLYAQSDVFVFPSHEGAGMVISEALSYGLPVICLDNAGPGEFVKSSFARAIPYENRKRVVGNLSVAMSEYYLKPELLKNHSLMAKNHFEEVFDWNKKSKRLEKVYQTV